MWGSLGDSYRHLGDVQTVPSMRTRRRLRSLSATICVVLRPSAIVRPAPYYYVMLNDLDASQVSSSVMREIETDIDTIAEEVETSTAHRRMAVIYLQKKRTAESACGAGQSNRRPCPGYAKMADFSKLATSI